MHNSGVAIQNAAAQVRALLVAEAAKRLDVVADSLRTENGSVIAPDGRRLSYGELVADNMLHVQAQPTSKLKDPATFKVMGRSIPRVDIPAKVTGGAAYVQDLRLPGMVHARVVRPPSYGAQLSDCDTGAVEQMPGVVKVVRDGNFLAVVAEKEFQAVKAMRALAAVAKWQESARLPKQDDLPRRIDGVAVARHDDLRRIAMPRSAAARRSRRPIRGPISRMARSGHPVRSRNSSMAR